MSVATPAAKVVPGAEIRRFRRIVTGHDAKGQSIIVSDATSPHIMPIIVQSICAVTDF